MPGAPSQEVDAAAVALRQLDAIARMPEPAPVPPPSKALERQNSAHVVEQLRERGDVSREEITEAMREETHTQASYGQLGGMMSGLLGPNTFRADYATTRVAGRSRCKKCRKYFHAGDVRVGKRPPRVQQDIKAVRVHWYHPACIFKSFERAAYRRRPSNASATSRALTICGTRTARTSRRGPPPGARAARRNSRTTSRRRAAARNGR